MPSRTPYARAAQTGNAISLLLGLLALGLLMYFVLRPSHQAAQATATTEAGAPPGGSNLVRCEQLVSKLVRDTGGLGPQAQAGYDQLPPQCQKMMPNPASLAPVPQDAPEEAK